MFDLSSLIKSKGISPSIQRIRILEYLIKNRVHPSADKIYCELVKEIPSLSKTTVYNTLNLFREVGLVAAVIGDDEVNFDANTEMHGHFKCMECGEIFDIDVESLILKDPEGCDIREKHVYLKGVCKKCLESKNINDKGALNG